MSPLVIKSELLDFKALTLGSCLSRTLQAFIRIHHTGLLHAMMVKGHCIRFSVSSSYHLRQFEQSPLQFYF